jgi:hypothetical protein
MKVEQELKYAAVVGGADTEEVTGYLVNRHTGVRIPDDEPVMVFRARDVHARRVIEFYHRLISGGVHSHSEAVAQRLADFHAFAEAHPERMKRPD